MVTWQWMPPAMHCPVPRKIKYIEIHILKQFETCFCFRAVLLHDFSLLGARIGNCYFQWQVLGRLQVPASRKGRSAERRCCPQGGFIKTSSGAASIWAFPASRKGRSAERRCCPQGGFIKTSSGAASIWAFHKHRYQTHPNT